VLDAASFICPIPVKDPGRARNFYTDALGLAVVDESAAGTLLAVGGARILLFQSASDTPPGHTLAGWEVPALEPVIAALESRGVAFEDYDLPGLRTENHIAWIGPERAAWFRDSEGNVLAISEPWVREPGDPRLGQGPSS
jgi:catechol 2,3-dioxygenase-like lactoylglutathione lyase family enzyme